MTHATIYAGLRTDLSRSLFTRAIGDGYIFRNRCFYGAFKRGYVACIDGKGPETCYYQAYQPTRTKWGSGVTFSKGMRNFWFLGYDWAKHLADPNVKPKPIQTFKAPPVKTTKIKPAFYSRKLKP